MKKILLALLVGLSSCQPVFAATKTPAKDITTTTTSFTHCLGPSNLDVQSSLNTIDSCLGGGGGTPGGINTQYQINNSGSFGGGNMYNVSGNVGINSTAPGSQLDVNGITRTKNLTISTGATAGYVWTASGTLGIGSWAPVSASGSVTNIATTAPITGGPITSTGTIGITQSTTSTNGYLSSTDWNIFNNKQPAGSYLTAVTADAPLSGSGTSGSHLVISQSTTSTNGYLSSTDWNTFNGKQAPGNYITALTGDVTASGPGSVAATLATVNSNVGSFTNTSITVNGKGLITAASSGTAVTGANPTAQVGLSSVNGVATTFLRSDGAPALDQGIIPTWTGLHTFNKSPISLVTAGNVGVGSTAPGNALDVTGTIRASTDIKIGSNSLCQSTGTNCPGSISGFANPSASVGLSAVNGVATTAMRSDSAPALDQSITPTWTGLHTFNKSPISLVTAANVGVGSTAPGTALDVTGTVRATGMRDTALTASTPVIADASKNLASGTYSGNTTTLATASGVLTNGHCVQIDASGNFVDAGGACTTGGGGGTVNSGAANQAAYYASAGTAVSGTNALTTDNTNVGVGTIAPITLFDVNRKFNVTSGGNVGVGTLSPQKALCVGSTCPGSIDSSGNGLLAGTLGVTGHVTLEAVTSTGATGTNKIVFDTTPTLVTPVIGAATGTSLALSGNIGVGGGGVSTNALQVTGTASVSVNIGIGSTTPGQALDVNGNARVRGANELFLGDDNKAGIQSSATTTPDIKLMTNSAEVMRITTGGNVGVGTTQPTQLFQVGTNLLNVPSGGNVGINTATAPQKLYVAGTGEFQGFKLNQNANAGYVMVSSSVGLGTWMPASTLPITGGSGTPGGSAGNLQWNSASSFAGVANSTVDSNGNIGLGGSPSPQAALTLLSGGVGIGTWTAPNTDMIIKGGNLGIGTSKPSASLEIGTPGKFKVDSLGNAGIGTNLTSGGYLVISGGNVGIGTGFPQAPLSVGGTSQFQVASTGAVTTNQVNFTMLSTNTLDGNFIQSGAGTPLVSLNNFASDNSRGQWNHLTNVTFAQNIGIGTSTQQAAIAIMGGGNVGLGTWTAAGGRMIVVGGNVGIGTAWPGTTLDVTGSIRASTGTANQAACWKADKTLGQCTSIVGAGGGCTCS